MARFDAFVCVCVEAGRAGGGEKKRTLETPAFWRFGGHVAEKVADRRRRLREKAPEGAGAATGPRSLLLARPLVIAPTPEKQGVSLHAKKQSATRGVASARQKSAFLLRL